MAKLNLDKMKAERGVGSIETVIATVALENGALVSLGDAVQGNREALEAIAPDPEKEHLLIARPEVKYNQFDKWDELDITTEAGTPVRALHIYSGDKYQAEQKLFVATPAVNDIVTGDAATYGYKVATGTEPTLLKVERLTKFGWDRRDMALLRAIRGK